MNTDLQIKNPSFKIVLSEFELQELHKKLWNRFRILEFVKAQGTFWPKLAIANVNDGVKYVCGISSDEYLSYYNNPQA